jgi:hypothetical protein
MDKPMASAFDQNAHTPLLSWGFRESNPVGPQTTRLQRAPVPYRQQPQKRKSRQGFPGRLLSEVLHTRSYWKGALPPGFSTRSWAGSSRHDEATPIPRINSAYESLDQDHSMVVLINIVSCAVSVVNRMFVLGEALITRLELTTETI